jgi:hypothetical protein
MGWASGVFGFALAIVGLALSLRAAHADASVVPVVAAAFVVARALTGLGVLAFGLSLMHLGERLLLGDRR